MRMLGFVGGFLVSAWASSVVYGQTVQLPSWHVFSVNTSVLAPDRGGTHLGGMRRSAQSVTRRGPLRNRSSAAGAAAGGASVHVSVVDHRKLDRAVLAAAAAHRGAASGASSGSTLRGPRSELVGRPDPMAARDPLNRALTLHRQVQLRQQLSRQAVGP